MSLPWIKEKKVEFILNQGKEFFFFVHEDYDLELDVLCSSYKEFKISIPKRIQPDVYKILDVQQFELDRKGFGGKMVITGRKDSVFQFDVVSPHTAYNDLKSRKKGKLTK
jgi:hypothetical protein